MTENNELNEQTNELEMLDETEARQVCGPNTTPYTVQSGDSFFTIARKFNVSLDALIEANPQIPDPSRIRPGQIVCIPQQPTSCPANTFRYVVQRGDTLFTIANRFGVSLQSLINANPQIPDPARLQPGQIVCVPYFSCSPQSFSYIVEPGDTLTSIAQKFGVSVQDLRNANPQITNPNQLYPGQNICIPRTAPPPTCPPGTFPYTVQQGDSMWSIAQKFHVSLDSLIAANPQIPDPSNIHPGQIVCVPQSSPPSQCPPGSFAYTVQQGDSMWSIAKKFGVSLDALIRANPQIPDPSKIYPGQIVCVPTTSPPPGTCPPGTFSYTVQAGDSMWSIARKFGVSLDALIRANPQISNPSLIYPGQKICVPGQSPPSQTCPPGTFRYTVQAGDSMWSIARKFGVSLDSLIRANPQISDPSKIKPGQVICVPNR